MEWFRVHEHNFSTEGSAPESSQTSLDTMLVSNNHAPSLKYTVESNRTAMEQAQPRAIPSYFSQNARIAMLDARSFRDRETYQPEPEMETMMDEDAQLEQQLQYQREEMLQYRARPTFPRIAPPSCSNNREHFTQQGPKDEGTTCYQTIHISPFSVPTKTSLASTFKPPVTPFGQGVSPSPCSSLSSRLSSFSMENSPRLPPLNMLRSASPHDMKKGIAGRSSNLSLRSFSDAGMSTIPSSSFTPITSYYPSPQSDPLPSLSPPHQRSHPLPSLSTSLPTLSTNSFSPSLPALSYLHQSLLNQEREGNRRRQDVVASSNDDEDDEEERDSAMLMMRLSSSMPDASVPRNGRVCRYAECNNIARSRGLCRTHGGGKRCSHPDCDKSAQANRKCIAHGGGTRCSFEDCEKTAQSRGLCKAHGGGARCKHPNCPKSSQSKGFCRGHGGGIKCREEGCDKWVQKNGYCIKHGRERSVTIG